MMGTFLSKTLYPPPPKNVQNVPNDGKEVKDDKCLLCNLLKDNHGIEILKITKKAPAHKERKQTTVTDPNSHENLKDINDTTFSLLSEVIRECVGDLSPDLKCMASYANGIRKFLQWMFSPKRCCNVCAQIATNFCTQCKTILYCTKKCQIQDWKLHEINCVLLQQHYDRLLHLSRSFSEHAVFSMLYILDTIVKECGVKQHQNIDNYIADTISAFDSVVIEEETVLVEDLLAGEREQMIESLNVLEQALPIKFCMSTKMLLSSFNIKICTSFDVLNKSDNTSKLEINVSEVSSEDMLFTQQTGNTMTKKVQTDQQEIGERAGNTLEEEMGCCEYIRTSKLVENSDFEKAVSIHDCVNEILKQNENLSNDQTKAKS